MALQWGLKSPQTQSGASEVIPTVQKDDDVPHQGEHQFGTTQKGNVFRDPRRYDLQGFTTLEILVNLAGQFGLSKFLNLPYHEGAIVSISFQILIDD